MSVPKHAPWLCILLLSACGGGGSDSPNSASSPTPAPPSTPSSNQVVFSLSVESIKIEHAGEAVSVETGTLKSGDLTLKK